MKLTTPRFLILIATLIGFDQVIKFAVETFLPFQTVVDVMPFIGLYRTWNEGVAFSLLWGFDERFLLILTSGITCLVGIMAYRTREEEWVSRLSYGMIMSGALGNIIDRYTYGHVIDYVLFHGQNWSFAVFNLADAFISLGAALLIFGEFFFKKPK
jgi:signal peptidase II